MPSAPADGEVHVWVADLGVDPGAAALRSLDAGERARAARLRVPGAARRFERRRIALRLILADYLECEPAAVAVDRTCEHCGHPTHGRPRPAAGGWAVSTAASGDVALVAVGRGMRLGIDIEDPDAVAAAVGHSPPPGLLTDRERALGALGRVWVRKEALAKARGTGLVADAAELDTTEVPEGWTVADLPDLGGLQAALAADVPLTAVRIEEHGARAVPAGR
jgi:4'-phosphopantetheinyl transferase